MAFVLGGAKKGHEVVLKVPLIPEDSNSTSLSVMIPPFTLTKKSNGKAGVFLVPTGS